jgi:hypothetical protein
MHHLHLHHPHLAPPTLAPKQCYPDSINVFRWWNTYDSPAILQ